MKRHLGTGRDTVTPLDWRYARTRLSCAGSRYRLTSVVSVRRCMASFAEQLLGERYRRRAALRRTEEGRPDVPSPSRLFIYRNERVLAGHAAFAGGASLARRSIEFRNTWDFWTMQRVS